MKYGLSRKVQLERKIGPKFKYESMEFFVEGADTKKEAERELDKWMRNYFHDLREQLKVIDLKKPPFIGNEYAKKN